WINPAYNDSSWSSGTAYLGNENCNCLPPPVGPQISTVLSLFDPSGVNRVVTFYFRKTFVVTNDPTGFNLTANVVLDDGAVIYLNGVEGLRVRMNAGTPTYTTQANTVVSDASSIETFRFQSGTLTLGTNVLAVEVHQGGIPSSDIVWGMSLDAVKTITNAPSNKVALNELMANNVTITNNGTVTDWVELY